MKKLIAICAVLTMVAATASAALVDFEDIAVSPGTNDIGGDRTSGGFLFDSLTNHTHRVNGALLADNGTTYLVADDYYGTNPLTMSMVSGGTFSVLSLDIAEWGDSASDYAKTVTVTGNLQGGGTVTKTITLDGVFDGTGPLVDFQTEVFGADWRLNNLTSVVFKGYDSISSHDYFAIDNIQVPEPATMILLGLGSGAVIRKRRQ